MLSNNYGIMVLATVKQPTTLIALMYILLPILLLSAVVATIFIVKRKHLNQDEGIDQDAIENIVERTGYAYDAKQDIFYSTKDAWQRKYGFCRLYDEAAAPLSMIVDSEPIHFEYQNKRWLIELWKGQYGMTTGAEVGVYNTEGSDLNIPGVFNGIFYNCADDNDQLFISYSLRKYGTVLFSREDKHWWLTGFMLGVFTEPSELMMDVRITFKDSEMCNVFKNALKQKGYLEHEYNVTNNVVSILFNRPHSPQPLTRTEPTDWITQRKNQMLCEEYQKLTEGYATTPEKIASLKKKAPHLYNLILHMGRQKLNYKGYKAIERRLL